MSVPTWLRHENELSVLESAQKIAEYSIKICMNEKVFPKRYRWVYTDHITETAISIGINIRSANAILVRMDQDYYLRRNFQYMAKCGIENLLFLLQTAHNLVKIENRRLEYWVGLILDCDKKLRGWINSDYKRFVNAVQKGSVLLTSPIIAPISNNLITPMNSPLYGAPIVPQPQYLDYASLSPIPTKFVPMNLDSENPMVYDNLIEMVRIVNGNNNKYDNNRIA